MRHIFNAYLESLYPEFYKKARELSNKDLKEEYSLIEAKKSKLSRSQRNVIVKLYNKRFKK